MSSRKKVMQRKRDRIRRERIKEIDQMDRISEDGVRG